jgi:hypothetical protein
MSTIYEFKSLLYSNPSWCLDIQASETENFTPLYLFPCDETKAQLFEFDESDKIRSALDGGFCVEGDTATNFPDQVFLHSSCQDTWTYFVDNTLKNDGEGLCMAVGGVEGTEVSLKTCSEGQEQKWMISTIVNPAPSPITDIVNPTPSPITDILPTNPFPAPPVASASTPDSELVAIVLGTLISLASLVVALVAERRARRSDAPRQDDASAAQGAPHAQDARKGGAADASAPFFQPAQQKKKIFAGACIGFIVGVIVVIVGVVWLA